MYFTLPGLYFPVPFFGAEAWFVEIAVLGYIAVVVTFGWNVYPNAFSIGTS